MRVTVYTSPNCMPCQQTKKQFDKRGIVYDVINLEQHPDKAEEMKELGYMQTPIVVADDAHWSGFRMDKIQRLEHLIFKDKREGQK